MFVCPGCNRVLAQTIYKEETQFWFTVSAHNQLALLVQEACVIGGCSSQSRQESGEKNREEEGARNSGHPLCEDKHIPRDPLLPINFTFHFPSLSNSSSEKESISGIIHWLGQCPYNPLINLTSELCFGDKAFNTWTFGGHSNHNCVVFGHNCSIWCFSRKYLELATVSHCMGLSK